MVISSNPPTATPNTLNTATGATASGRTNSDSTAVDALAGGGDVQDASLTDSPDATFNNFLSSLADASSAGQTQAGYLKSAHRALHRMEKLATEAQDPNLSPSDRARVSQEFSKLQDYLNGVSQKSSDGTPVFSAAPTQAVDGANGNTVSTGGVDLAGNPVYAAALSSNLSLDNATDAQAAATAVGQALQQVGQDQSRLGNFQSQVGAASDQTLAARDAAQSSASTISSAGAAQQAVAFLYNWILGNPTDAIGAQANVQPQTAAALLAA